MKSLADVCRRLRGAGGFLTERNIKAAFPLENAAFIMPERPLEADLDLQFLSWELGRWLDSPKRRWMEVGEEYFAGRQDILRQQRQVLGRNGQLEPAHNLPNNRLVNNQYAKLVNQKTNYLLGQPLTWECDRPEFAAALGRVFDRPFMRLLKRLGKACYNQGIAWLYPYVGVDGRLRFALFGGREVLPFWADAEHTRLEAALRFFSWRFWQKGRLQTLWGAELFGPDGRRLLAWNPAKGRLTPWPWPTAEEAAGRQAYLSWQGPAAGKRTAFNWQRVPLVAFKLNEREQPLICRVKGLQDALNTMLSGFENVLQEDARNTILVIRNYDGTDLAEFRHNLAAFGAVKVKTVDGAEGGIDTLSVQVDAGNYQAILELLQRAIIENGLGFDSKLERSLRAANELNIKSMYSDICLDANDLETEWQAALSELLWFVNSYLAFSGQGDFFDCHCRFIFNRDIMLDESEAIDNCLKSLGLLSRRSVVAQHPWVDDVEKELARLASEEVGEIGGVGAGGKGE